MLGLNRENNDDDNSSELIMKWFKKEAGEGENSILVYPNLQSFRQIYTRYAKDQLTPKEVGREEEQDSNESNSSSRSRLNKELSTNSSIIMLIAPFYESIESVKHELCAVGMQNVQSLIDNSSLVIVDAFSSYYPDIEGMKKLVASLSQRARKEGRAGVSAIVDMGFFFLFGGDGKATELINYESSLAPKTKGGNIKGLSCYHEGNYNTLKDNQKEELAQKGKKLFEITESTFTSWCMRSGRRKQA
jgi:hypothetical protein